tara:strand:- start:4779 stop:5813 length:1035 start_codon:yes stop_codon:yes gene_type:complete
MHQTETRELRLQLASTGDVWATTWLEPHPRRVATSVEEFVETPLFNDSTSAAVVGYPINVGLITEIYLRRHDDPDYMIWVASPLLAGATKINRIDPVFVLEASKGLDPHLSPSLGGWHQFCKKDYPAYALADVMQKGTAVSDQVLKLLHAHPVWPALSFVSGLNQAMCCRVIGTILDPRWYVDLDQPVRTSRLESYLGLSLGVQRIALDILGDQKTVKTRSEDIQKEIDDLSAYEGRRVNYCISVQHCWWKDPDLLLPADGGETDGVPLLQAPGGFLWRVWFSHGRTPKGYLRTSQQFIRFLRDAWLDALYSETVGDSLFIPEYFFKHDYEQLAYIQHMEKFKG